VSGPQGAPVYVISKGRFTMPLALTARALRHYSQPFRLVVEPQEAEQYAAAFGAERVLILPFSNLGQGSIPARNWVWEHAKSEGHGWHWILDDNIRNFYRRYQAIRIPCAPQICFAATERFVDRYENIAIAGLNYKMWAFPHVKMPPFYLNTRVYSCLLIRNDLPHRWRGRYNEDTDLCLQVLADGWCTILLNAFLCDKIATMRMKGGNTDALYTGDGRLKMARALERAWPGVVKTGRRWNRPQHIIDWSKFCTRLKRREGVDDATHGILDSDMRLTQVKEKVKNSRLRGLLASEREADRG
jgi:TET-associated glycosyltransferase-like protein